MTRGNKYGAVKVVVDNIRFDSKAEAKRYGELKLLEKAGLITELDVHPTYDITVKGHHIATYTPDFDYLDEKGKLRVEDVKSPPTARKRDFVLIRKLFKATQGIDVEIVGSRSLPTEKKRAA